ncbi:MAG TPA: hypothetical protein VFL10_10685 [Ornithinibacter sp.]|nr:hypothetical protein [Ornithinibacter sp.]
MVPHVTLRETSPDVESEVFGFVPTGAVGRHGEVHLALDLSGPPGGPSCDDDAVRRPA